MISKEERAARDLAVAKFFKEGGQKVDLPPETWEHYLAKETLHSTVPLLTEEELEGLGEEEDKEDESTGE